MGSNRLTRCNGRRRKFRSGTRVPELPSLSNLLPGETHETRLL